MDYDFPSIYETYGCSNLQEYIHIHSQYIQTCIYTYAESSLSKHVVAREQFWSKSYFNYIIYNISHRALESNNGLARRQFEHIDPLMQSKLRDVKLQPRVDLLSARKVLDMHSNRGYHITFQLEYKSTSFFSSGFQSHEAA